MFCIFLQKFIVYIKVIITISGKAGSGKSTVARLLSEKLNLQHYSIGDLMRAMASEKGLSLIELNKLAERDSSIDVELDNRLKALGETKDNFVVDGRLTAFFIPKAQIRIFLDANVQVRAQRILKDRRKQEKNASLKEAIANIKKREESEKKRYKKYYGVNYLDKRLYNYAVNTTKMDPQQVADKIIKSIRKEHCAHIITHKSFLTI